MISKELQNIITSITEKTVSRASWLRGAEGYKLAAEDNLKSAEGHMEEAKKLELEIDQLQLAMRTVLNGEPSTIKVDAPKQPEEQIGREG